MKNTGQLLKEAREKKGISIAEVSLATKINSRILSAIEQGNLTKLPPKTFLRGFVLSYSTFLGLDAEQVMKMFQEEMGTTRPSPEMSDASLAATPTSDRSADEMTRNNNSVAKIAAVIGIILLVVIIILLKKKMESYESESVPQTETAAVIPDAGAIPSTEPMSPTSTPTEANSTTAAAVSASTPAANTTAVATPAALATPKATPKPVPTVAPAATPAAAAPVTASPSPKPSATPAPAAKVQDVTIEALDDVDVEAVIDGETKTIHLKAEQVHTIKARRKVSLRLSDGGAVSIIVNGNDRGVPGDLGKPMKVDIP